MNGSEQMNQEQKHSYLSLRGRNVYKIWEVPLDAPVYESSQAPETIAEVKGEILATAWAPNGSVLAMNLADRGLVLYGPNALGNDQGCPLSVPEGLSKVPAKQLKWFGFSPQGSYLYAYWAPSGHQLTEITGPNYHIYRVKRNGNKVIGAEVLLSIRLLRGSQPGPVQWRDDEKYRLCSNGDKLEISRGHDFGGKPLFSLALPPRFTAGIAPACPTNADGIVVTMFAPATQQTPRKPGEVRILFLGAGEGGSGCCKVGVSELPDVDGCDFLWAPSRRKCLLLTSTLVDSAGENYGSIGDAWLCDLEANRDEVTTSDESADSLKDTMGLQGGSVATLLLTKINSRVTQDAKWSPTTDELVLIEGKSPSDIFLVDGNTAQRLHSFPRGYKNTVCWGPLGDMVAIGGFGNLAGDLTFHYRAPDGSITQIADWREACTVVCNWSPCGRYFFTASTRPRMNVDNVVKLWTREGIKILEVPFDELYEVAWQVDRVTNFPPPPVPRANMATSKVNTYRIKNRNRNTELISRYLAGEITDKELPEDLQKRMKGKPGQRPFDKSRYAPNNQRGTKDVDFALDWRSGPSESVSESHETHSPPVSLPPSNETKSRKQPGKQQQAEDKTVPVVVPSAAAVDPTPIQVPPAPSLQQREEAPPSESVILPEYYQPQVAPPPPPPRPTSLHEDPDLPHHPVSEVTLPQGYTVSDLRSQSDMPWMFDIQERVMRGHIPPSQHQPYSAPQQRIAPPPPEPAPVPAPAAADTSSVAQLLKSMLPHVTVKVEHDRLGNVAPPPVAAAAEAFVEGLDRRNPQNRFPPPRRNQPPPPPPPPPPPSNAVAPLEEQQHLLRLIQQAGLPYMMDNSASLNQQPGPRSFGSVNEPNQYQGSDARSQTSDSRQYAPSPGDRPAYCGERHEPSQYMGGGNDRSYGPGNQTSSDLRYSHDRQFGQQGNDERIGYNGGLPENQYRGGDRGYGGPPSQYGDRGNYGGEQFRQPPEPYRQGSGDQFRQGANQQHYRMGQQGSQGSMDASSQDWSSSQQLLDLLSASASVLRTVNPNSKGQDGYGAHDNLGMKGYNKRRVEAPVQPPMRAPQVRPNNGPPPPNKDRKIRGDDRIWQYVDPKGNIQGPFTGREMRTWWEKGYFAQTLPVRCEMNAQFTPLKDFFPDSTRVFATSPSR